jgi:2-polyprenyl-3-methyl-5-hydroxy-6-metoxy-1,4-benzoquinol methylase
MLSAMLPVLRHPPKFSETPATNESRAWQQLGSLEPYFAVLTNPDFLSANLTPERLEEFFASGEKEVQDLLEDARSLFRFDIPFDSALDFGCGVGRLSIPLARRARRVLAVDTADSMLARARMHCAASQVENVEFLTLNDFFAVPPSSVHLACAHLVLQHVPPSSGDRILRRLLSLVAPEGLLSVDITFHRAGSRFRRVGRWLRAHSRLVHAAASVVRRTRPSLPYVQMNSYDLGSILQAFSVSGFSRHLVTVSSDGPLLNARILSQRGDR